MQVPSISRKVKLTYSSALMALPHGSGMKRTDDISLEASAPNNQLPVVRHKLQCPELLTRLSTYPTQDLVR